MLCYRVKIIWDCHSYPMDPCLRRNNTRLNPKFNMSKMDYFKGIIPFNPYLPPFSGGAFALGVNGSPPYALQLVGIPPAGAKSRVETQIKLDLQLLHHRSQDFVKDTYEYLKLPSYGVSKEKFRLPNLKGTPPYPEPLTRNPC